MQQNARTVCVRPLAASLLLGLLATGTASAQDISIVPTLRAGDAFQLEVIRIRENSAQPQQNGRSTTRVDVRVISANAEGSMIEWMPGATVFDNPQAASNPLVGLTSQALRDIRFQLRLNADGELQEMANQAEVAPKLKAAVDTVVLSLSAQMHESQRKQFLDFMSQVLSVDVLMASATRDAATYLGLNGVSLAAGEAAEADLEQPSPLGGGTIAAKFRVRMDSASAERASLSTTTTYDAAALMRMTAAVTKQAGAPIPPEELAKLPPMTMADEGIYVFDRTVGLMREVKVSRRIAVGPGGRLDAWEIRLISGPR
jgi:hypothetical protein